MKACDRVLFKQPRDAEALLRRSSVFVAMNKYEAAASDLRKILEAGPNPEAEQVLTMLKRMGYLSGPVSNNDRTSSAASQDDEAAPVAVARRVLAVLRRTRDQGNSAMKAKRYEQAAVHYALALDNLATATASVDKDVQNEVVELETNLQLRLSRARFKMKDFDGAAKAVEPLLKRQPEHTEALYRRAMAFVQNNNVEGATADFMTAAAQNPSLARSFFATNENQAERSPFSDDEDDQDQDTLAEEVIRRRAQEAEEERARVKEELQSARERERVKEQEKEQQKRRAKELEKAIERERVKEQEKEQQKKRMEELEKAMERERVKEQEKEQQKKREEEREKAREKEREVARQQESEEKERKERAAARLKSASTPGDARGSQHQSPKAVSGGSGGTGNEAKTNGAHDDFASESDSSSRLRRICNEAEAMKALGNQQLKRDDFLGALRSYGCGAELLAGDDGGGCSEELKTEARQLATVLQLNLALANQRAGLFEAAVASADAALKLQPGNVKGLFRRAQAQSSLATELDQAQVKAPTEELRRKAESDLRQVLLAEPQNADARKALIPLLAAKQSATAAAKDEVEKKGQRGAEAAPSPKQNPDGSNPFVGIFSDPTALKERSRQAKERRQEDEQARLRELGNVAHRSGDYAAAVTHYSAAITLQPKNSGLLLNRAAALIMLQKLEEALADCKLAAELEPGLPKAYLRGARCMQLLGDLAGAEEYLLNSVSNIPPALQSEIVDQIAGIERMRRLVADAEALLTPDLTGAMLGKQALNLVLDAERFGVPDSLIRPLRLQALLQANDHDEANEAKEISGVLLEDATLAADPRIWFWRALSLLRSGDRDEAKAALREVSARASEDSELHPVCPHAAALADRLAKAEALKEDGNRFFSQRRWEEAAECYADACQSAADDVSMLSVVHTNTAAALRKVEGRAEDAFRHATLATKAGPRYAKAFFRRGVLNFDACRWKASLEDFEKATRLEPKLQGVEEWRRRARHAINEGKDRVDHYKVLSLLCDCTQDEVKRKFRKMARECHPDKIQCASPSEKIDSESRFKAINEAHEVLSSVQKRKEFDFGPDEPVCRMFGGGGNDFFPSSSFFRGASGSGGGARPWSYMQPNDWFD
eukprot:TRINITY_DN357_c1_g1_i1.p1 TRINITY_DN357_c1_g1~~TRINITY_DN357_c1_g1_i1.p1  ORF type:complete len:1289 (+),score=339.94 TRINITY_DN357_c1_g1_i1:506-3868(+)